MRLRPKLKIRNPIFPSTLNYQLSTGYTPAMPSPLPQLTDDERLRGRVPMLSIVMPAYNEAATIARTLARIMEVTLPCKREIIVVDDASIDKTREAVAPFIAGGAVRYLRLAKNSGKGAALRAGFAVARGDYVIVQDADEEYDPRDIPALVAPLMDGTARAVYGSRVINEHCFKRGRWTNPFWYGGRALSLIANLLFCKCRISDEAVGYKALRMDVLRSIPLRCTGFEFCPELTAKLSRRGVAIYNVPIHYSPRPVAAGKKIRAHHWFEAVGTLLTYRFVSDHGPVADFEPLAPEVAEDSGKG